jgi:ATP-binding cassette subfamily B (MDR/TAP) protein 1
MAFDNIFRAWYDASVNKSLATGIQGAFVEGCTQGVANSPIYLSEALLFYVRMLLIARGLNSYLQITKVLSLMVFSVTIRSQSMGISELSDFLLHNI